MRIICQTETEQTRGEVLAAKIINLGCLNKINDNLKRRSEKYLHLINCDWLITPKVNLKIWGCLDWQMRGKDLKLSSLQRVLTKVCNITAKTTDMLLKAHTENSQLDVKAMIWMNWIIPAKPRFYSADYVWPTCQSPLCHLGFSCKHTLTTSLLVKKKTHQHCRYLHLF